MIKKWKTCLSVLLSAALLLGGIGQPVQQAQAAEEQPIVWMSKNAEWKYLDTGVDQGNSWQSSYGDKDWAIGQAPLGFAATTTKFGSLNTTISFGSDSRNKHTTSYFVTNLNVDLDEINSYGQLLGNFGIDDGAVMYVNGTEVFRAGMPEGTITYSTFATSNKSNPVLYNEIDLTAPLKANLQDGDNVIAVEVHQSTLTSSDLYFDMELTAMLDAPPLEVSKVVVTFNGNPQTSKGFVWYTPLTSTRSDLEVVEKTGGQADFGNAQAFIGNAKTATNSIAEHVHKAEAAGLKPDTEYFFRVGDKDLNIWSETGVFETAPAEKVPFTFIDLTDTQAKEEDEAILSGQTLEKALATVPDAKFVVHNGDVVENGTAEEEWNWLLGHSQNSLLRTTIVPAAGNHEPSGSSFFEHFNLQQAENSATVSGAYYSYDYSNVHFIVLNTNENSSEYANMSLEQVEWLKQDVAKAKEAGAEWIILNMHKGPYTTASHATDTDIMGATGLRTKIAPLIAELKIDLVLQGHDHIYARTKPIQSDGTAEDVEKITETLNGESIEYAVKPDGTIYLIPGTAGAKVYKKNTKTQLGDDYFNLFERSEENHSQKYADTPAGVTGQVQNFVGITVDGGKLTAVSYEIDQNLNDAKPFIIDQFGIMKDNAEVLEKVSKVTVTFHGNPVHDKGFTWYTSHKVTGSDLQVIEKTGEIADFAEATTFQGRSAASTNSPSELVHKAEATALKANTSYFFRVGDKEAGIWSETGTFATAPESGAFTFIDLADTQAKDEEEAILSSETLAKALKTVPYAQFVVHNGDIVDKGIVEDQWNWLLGHSQNSLLNTTIVPSAGNHEDKNFAFYEHFNIKQPEGSAIETGAYYSYTYSNAHFIVLNSNEDSEEYANFSVEQVEWLKQDVKKAKEAGAEWIIVNIHKGPYTTSNHATDSDIMGENGVRNKIAPLMAELGIDFVLQGHDHIYARTKPIKKDGSAAETEIITEQLNGQTIQYTLNPDGSIYLIPATAGPKVYFKNKKPELGDSYYDLFERAEENHAAKYGFDGDRTDRPKRGQVQNFVGITIDGNKLTAVSYEIDQNLNDAEPFIIDQFGIVKQKSTGPVTPPVTTPVTPPVTGPVVTPNPTPTPTVTPSPSPVPTPGTGGGETPSPAPATTFKDDKGHWAEENIKKAVADGLITGYDDNTFRPNKVVSRAEFVTILGRALSLEPVSNPVAFKDMDKIPSWAQDHVAKAVQAGIINGYSDETFGPANALNRAEMITMIIRAAGIKPDANANVSFADANDIPAWAIPYVATASQMGLTNGVGGNRFAPLKSATRAEALTIILALQEQLNK
ncbi:S-layer homology domain-containing protein [Paenibacillus sp. CAU 1782]